LPSISRSCRIYLQRCRQWCRDVTDYVFTPDTLTVKFHDSRPANIFKITKYTYTNNGVSIDWLNDAGKESVTVFAEFSVTVPPWRSRKTATNHADLSAAAEILGRRR
jgi:hypothetical protein